MPSLAVIIPVFNKWELTRNCLLSLAAHTPTDIRPARIIVADNGSSDNTAAACPIQGNELFGDSFSYLRFDRNLNFGPACNAAARLADEDLLFFLNNDTLLTPGWLPPLLEEMSGDCPPAGTGPLLTYDDGTVQHLGVFIGPAGAIVGHLYRSIPAEHPLAMRRRKFQALTAAALLLPRQTFLDAEGFCEEFINGFEDVDLGLRLTADGSRMTVRPESRIFHLESQTPTRHDSDRHNSLLLRERHNLAAREDLPDLLAEDGYVLNISPDFTVTVSVTPEKSRELLRRLNENHRPDHSLCRKLLEEEPYWEEGYVLLGCLLERQGMWEDVAAIYRRALQLMPSLDFQTKMLRAATRSNINVDSLRESYARSVDFIFDTKPYAARLALYRSILEEHGRSALIPAYEEAAHQAAVFRNEWKKNKG